MDISSQIVPAIIILVTNLMSGKHSTLQWEVVTAVFGWSFLICTIGYILVVYINPESIVVTYLLQIAGFCLITALSRDYEKILRPLFPWNR